MLSFDSYPLWLNALIFALSAGTIWITGHRLERYAGAITERTKLGQAFTGLLFLSIATSLPEVATTITAVALLNNPTLAVHNLLGGVAMQTAILVVADRAKRERGALTFFSPRFVLLIEGVGLVALLQITIAGITARGFPSFASVGVWSLVIFLVHIGIMYLVYRYEGNPRWTPHDKGESHVERDLQGSAERKDETNRRPISRVWLLFSVASLIVLLGGWAAAQSADILAEQTGLGSAFLGATLLALATSLPELSTTIAASRNRRYSMAISNVFGSNAFDVSLLFLADLLYRGGAIMQHAEWSVVFIAAIGAILTCIYLWGLMERENRSVLGIGWDSAAVLLIYMGAMGAFYFIV